MNLPAALHTMPNACPGDEAHVCDSSEDIIAGPNVGRRALTALDVGHDDYYAIAGSPSWDIRNSAFLTRLDVAPAVISVHIDGVAGGSVRSDVPGIACPGWCSVPWNPGLRVVLFAAPSAGYRFAGWSGACAASGNQPGCQTPPLDGQLTIGARFVPTVSIDVAVRGPGRVVSTTGNRRQTCTGTCRITVDADTVLTLRARGLRGGELVSWRGACRGSHALPCAPE